ncbi:MAG: undecaprenyl-diphosphatase UppP [Candidatus Buchananbacteria bacterium]
MDYLLAILAGAIQGITEFIPVSSSGHLVLFHDIFKFNLPDNLMFDALLHLGTLVALIIFFFKDIIKLIAGFFSSLVKWNLKNDQNQKLAWMIIIGIIPAGLIGYFSEDLINKYLHQSIYSSLVVAIMLIVVAILFFAIEKYASLKKDLTELTAKDSIILGFAQAVALIPGTSRSGITIIAGMWRNFKREEAARFSFLLSIPIILGAGLKSFMDVGEWSAQQMPLFAVAFLTSAITGYFAIKFLLKFLSNHSLKAFAWYRLIIGCLILIWFFSFLLS